MYHVYYEQEAQLSLTNQHRAEWQDFLSEYVDKKSRTYAIQTVN